MLSSLISNTHQTALKVSKDVHLWHCLDLFCKTSPSGKLQLVTQRVRHGVEETLLFLGNTDFCNSDFSENAIKSMTLTYDLENLFITHENNKIYLTKVFTLTTWCSFDPIQMIWPMFAAHFYLLITLAVSPQWQQKTLILVEFWI